MSDPEQIEAWCTDSVEITRKTVADLADELKGKKKAVTNTGAGEQGGGQNPGADDADKFSHGKISGGTGEFFVMTKFPVVAEAAKARAKVVPEHLSALKFTSTVYTPDFMTKAS